MTAAAGCGSPAPEPSPDAPDPEQEPAPPEDPGDESLLGPADIDLVILSPAPGSWTTETSLEVTGAMEGLTDLTVNGEPATLNGGSWSGSVPTEPGIVPITVRGLDEHGYAHERRRWALAGDFNADVDQTGNTMRTRLNQGALDRGLEELASLFSAEAVEAQLLKDSRIYADALFWVYVTGIDFGTPVVAFELSEGAIRLSLELPDLEMSFWYDGPASWNGDAFVSASAVRVDAELALGIRDGDMTASVASASVEIDDFYFDVEYSLGIEHLLQDVVQGALEDAIEEALNAEVAPYIEAGFEALDLSFTETVLGVDFHIAAAFDELAIDEDGIEMLTSVSISTSGANTPPHEAPGWFTRRFEPSALSRDNDVAMALSDNLLNHLFHTAWSAGLLTDELATADGTLSRLFLSLIGATEGSLEIDGALPLVLEERGGQLELQLGSFRIDVYTPGAAMGEHLGLVAGGSLPVILGLYDRSLVLTVGNPALRLDASDNDWLIRPEEIEALLVDGLPLDLVSSLVSGIAIPIPTYEGVVMTGASLERDQSSTVIEFDIQ